jgi:hypothetical protein
MAYKDTAVLSNMHFTGLQLGHSAKITELPKAVFQSKQFIEESFEDFNNHISLLYENFREKMWQNQLTRDTTFCGTKRYNSQKIWVISSGSIFGGFER